MFSSDGTCAHRSICSQREETIRLYPKDFYHKSQITNDSTSKKFDYTHSGILLSLMGTKGANQHKIVGEGAKILHQEDRRFV